jgi:hypothetical protein
VSSAVDGLRVAEAAALALCGVARGRPGFVRAYGRWRGGVSVDWLHSLPVALPRWMRDGVFTGYLAAPGFLPELLADLDVSGSAGPEHMVFGDLVFVRRAPCSAPAWAQHVWRNARLLAAPSIGQGARALRDTQRNWWPHPVRLARRAALIAEKLPRVSARPQVFGQPAPTAPLGSFTLWDEQTVIAASDCSSPYPDGQARFVEDRESAPSRAYLKLWEAFTLLGVQPACGELCLDFAPAPAAGPGFWRVLARVCSAWTKRRLIHGFPQCRKSSTASGPDSALNRELRADRAHGWTGCVRTWPATQRGCWNW